jgi:hypothetical protein
MSGSFTNATTSQDQTVLGKDHSIPLRMFLFNSLIVNQIVDTQAPLRLSSSEYSIPTTYMYISKLPTYKVHRMLVVDLLSVHLIRKAHGSTIISYHHGLDDHHTTSASYLHERVRFAGVFWSTVLE